MTRETIIESVSAKTGLTKGKTAEVLNEILVEMFDALVRGESIFLRRFGSFTLVTDQWRSVQNPKTFERTVIQKQRIKFTPCINIRTLLDERKERRQVKPQADTEGDYSE